MTIRSTTVSKNSIGETEYSSPSTKASEVQYLDAISKTTKWSQLVSKASHSASQKSNSMPQPLMLKKLKLNGSMKKYKTF